MRTLMDQSKNEINIVGKLLSTTFREGNTRDGKPYESCSYIVRVNQIIEGKDEIHEIPCSVFATKYTNAGKVNPAYRTVQEMKQMRTIQNDGEDGAAVLRIVKANISENVFVSQSGQVIDGWQIRSSFVNEGGMGELATFSIDIFIMDMHEETDSNEEPTGRLVVRGAVVQYGEKVDILDFIVEDPNKVEYISRNWETGTTVNARGRIRCTAQETARPAKTSSWGEDIPEATTKMVRELIISSGSDEPFEEEFAYNSTDIKKGLNIRKANIEQMQINAKNGGQKKQAAAAPSRNKYDWE